MRIIEPAVVEGEMAYKQFIYIEIHGMSCVSIEALHEGFALTRN